LSYTRIDFVFADYFAVRNLARKQMEQIPNALVRHRPNSH